MLVVESAAAGPDEVVTLTPAAAFFIAAAFVDFLKSKGVKDVKVMQQNSRARTRQLKGG